MGQGSRASRRARRGKLHASPRTPAAGRFEQVGTPPSRHRLAEALVRPPQPKPQPDDRGRMASLGPTTARSASAASGSSMKVRYCAKLNSHGRGANRRAATTWPGLGAAVRSVRPSRPATAARAPATAWPTAARTPDWLSGPVRRAAGQAFGHITGPRDRPRDRHAIVRRRVGSDAPLTVLMYGRVREGATPVLNAVSLLLMGRWRCWR